MKRLMDQIRVLWLGDIGDIGDIGIEEYPKGLREFLDRRLILADFRNKVPLGCGIVFESGMYSIF